MSGGVPRFPLSRPSRPRGPRPSRGPKVPRRRRPRATAPLGDRTADPGGVLRGGARAESISVPAGRVVRVSESVPPSTRPASRRPPGTRAPGPARRRDTGRHRRRRRTRRIRRAARHAPLGWGRAAAYAADVAPLTRLGADVVVARGAPADTAAAYRRAVPDGVDGLIDTAVLGEPALSAVRDGGGTVKCRPHHCRRPAASGCVRPSSWTPPAEPPRSPGSLGRAPSRRARPQCPLRRSRDACWRRAGVAAG